jgi:DNA mismatch repair ATPase MutS
VLNKRSISCTTVEVMALADRANEAISNALRLTHQMLDELKESAREHMDSLFAVTDCVVRFLGIASEFIVLKATT